MSSEDSRETLATESHGVLGSSGNLSFIQTLARYYSDFLETDFKKGRLPKRRFLTRDKKARRCGIPLEKFPSFIRVLKEQLSNDFESNYKLEVKPKVHQAKLSAITLAAVESAIKLIDFDELNERNEKSVEKFRSIIKGKNVDLEIECQNFVSSLEKNVASVIAIGCF